MPARKQNAKTTTKAAEPVATETPVEQTTASTVPAETTDTTFADKATAFAKKLQELNSLLSSLRTEFRALDKLGNKELKNAQKAGAKRKRKSGNRSPSGFVKPALISAELATFLGKPNGSEMARTEVTREINKYIRSNDLQDKENGRKINPDAKLTKLLKLKKSDELTYFNLQRYMSPHFPKTGAAAAAAAAAADAAGGAAVTTTD
jgi:chromatin remodeling complex protein RSC6